MKEYEDKIPFIFGKLAIQDNFTNREQETKRLIGNFVSGINTILISPRRWGKSSLVLKASQQAAKKHKQLRFCYIDLHSVKTEEEFYNTLAEEIMLSTSTKAEELIQNVKMFLNRFIPKITFGSGGIEDVEIGLDWKEVKNNPTEILNLAERIAVEKKIKLVICIDEFQAIAGFKDSGVLQKKLRSIWQKQQNTSYCIYGSKRHMMMDIFTSQAMPFYKFGDLMFLEKIKAADWKKFIEKRFRETKKNISAEAIDKIILYAQSHPHYVQQLSQIAWLRSNKSCKPDTVDLAYDGLLRQISLLFQSIADSLTAHQVNFLKAVILKEKHFSSKEILEKYALGTSANILRIKESLINREIIDTTNNEYYLNDPIFEGWLKRYFFNLKN